MWESEEEECRLKYKDEKNIGVRTSGKKEKTVFYINKVRKLFVVLEHVI